MEDALSQAPSRRMKPLVALKAINALLQDPEDTSQVFTIIRAMSGPSDNRNFERFRGTETGRRILSEKRRLIDVLSDREALAGLPEGSLGRHYLQFVQSENLTADGLVEADETAGGRREMEDDALLFGERNRDSHDLWHTVTGYGRDGLGEISLLAFSYAQLGNLGVAMIVYFGARAGNNETPKVGIWKAVWEGYRNGRKAEWLPAADWEAFLPLLLGEVRRRLNISKPTAYRAALDRIQSMTGTDQPLPPGAGAVEV